MMVIQVHQLVVERKPKPDRYVTIHQDEFCDI
jgi:hypothetical protein